MHMHVENQNLKTKVERKDNNVLCPGTNEPPKFLGLAVFGRRGL